jgi:chromosome segregation ATPase
VAHEDAEALKSDGHVARAEGQVTSRELAGEDSLALDGADVEGAIRAANREFAAQATSTLEALLSVLFDQRNRAIRKAHALREEMRRTRERMTEEQDRFIAFLVSDYEQQVAARDQRLESIQRELERRRPVLELVADEVSPESSPTLDLPEQIIALQENLRAAQGEADALRSDLKQVREERDEAIRETNEVRQEYTARLERAQDEAVQLSWQLDEAKRQLHETRDEMRDEAHRLAKLLAEAKSELDERNRELRGLRARLMELDHEVHSRPPPSAAVELENARNEVQLVRKQLIEAKREQSRLTQELQILRSGRLGATDIALAAGERKLSS